MSMTEIECIDVLKNLAFLSGKKEHEKCEKAIEMAIQALEKQIPKKPYSDLKGLLDAKMWHCPVCKKEVISDWNRDLANDYCHNCGQKLDWQ